MPIASNPVKAAQERLLSEIYNDPKMLNAWAGRMHGDFLRLSNESNKRYEGYVDHGLAEKTDYLTAFKEATMLMFSRVLVEVRTKSAITQTLLATVYKWLPEAGQREASRELAALTVQDVFSLDHRE